MKRIEAYTLLVLVFVMAIVTIIVQVKSEARPMEPQLAVAWRSGTPPTDVPLLGLWYWSVDPADAPLPSLFIFTRFGTFWEYPGFGVETMERSAPDFWARLPGEVEAQP